jgi:GAF domain-containing protein
MQEGDGRRLVAPISLRDQTLGSLMLRREPEQDPWSPQEQAMVEEVSTQIAQALEYARLLEETQRRATRERLISDASTRIGEWLDVRRVLQTAADEMYQVLDLKKIEIRLMADKTNGDP